MYTVANSPDIVLFCVLNRDVGNSGFSKCIPLHQGNLFDSILCAEVADVNWDGRNEIVLGTFGKVSSVK